MRTWIIAAVCFVPALALAQPAPPTLPTPNPDQLKQACNAALNAADKAGNKIFIADVASVASGATSKAELAKTSEGQVCLAALASVPDFQKSTADTALEDAANELVANTKRQHEAAAMAIAKNEKHVVLAYAAMWLLSVGFVLFLWRRQQGLRTEIAQLRRDLEAASK